MVARRRAGHGAPPRRRRRRGDDVPARLAVADPVRGRVRGHGPPRRASAPDRGGGPRRARGDGDVPAVRVTARNRGHIRLGRTDDQALDERRRARRAAGVRVEPPRRDEERRRGTRARARRPARGAGVQLGAAGGDDASLRRRWRRQLCSRVAFDRTQRRRHPAALRRIATEHLHDPSPRHEHESPVVEQRHAAERAKGATAGRDPPCDGAERQLLDVELRARAMEVVDAFGLALALAVDEERTAGTLGLGRGQREPCERLAEPVDGDAGAALRVSGVLAVEVRRPVLATGEERERSDDESSPEHRSTLPRMRVLVTAAAGFIGSHFVRRVVARGDEVTVLDKLTYSGNRANLKGVDHRFVHGDICDAAGVADAADGCDAIVNFAAETHVDRSILDAAEFIQTDVAGTQVLLELARRAGIRHVQVSTDEVYGDLERGGRSKEDDPLRPSSPYSASKAGGDLQVLAYARTFGVDACISRGANTYGPRQYPEKLLPLFITNVLDGDPLPLYGDGRQIREWLHVEDHAAAIELVLREGRSGEIYNVGGEERENLEVTRRVLALAGADESLVRHVADRPGHDRRYALDSSKLEALGWTREREFEQGLAETFAWYRDNRDWWEPIKSGEFRAYYETQYAARLGV